MTPSINKFCPRSGKPVAPNSLTTYKGRTVEFCNPGCRDHFASDRSNNSSDTRYFDILIKELEV